MHKLVEKIVAKLLLKHLLDNDLYEQFQLAYRTGHSMETALSRVSNDILLALDNRQSVFIVLLDLLAGFHTIDHGLLLGMLENQHGITGAVVRWFTSYLTDRTQMVVIHGVKSEAQPLELTVPQGLVLGPMLFMLYSTPVRITARMHGLSVHLYANDSELYLAFR